MKINLDDFQEISHCGGVYKFKKIVDKNGNVGISQSYQTNNPTPMAIFGVYSLRNGIPVAPLPLEGVGTPFQKPPHPECIPILIASDSLGYFGFQCNNCTNYWRSRSAPTSWDVTCCYCGYNAPRHAFLTNGHINYVRYYCDKLNSFLYSEEIELELSLDKIADEVLNGAKRPEFYYTEEKQQTLLNCNYCNSQNDILGKYCFCCCCGTNISILEFKNDINKIRSEMKGDASYSDKLKSAISHFDGYCKYLMRVLLGKIPISNARRVFWRDRLFHKLELCVNHLKSDFDINLLHGISSEEFEYCKIKFFRRHIYEHNSSMVDQKYIQESNDNSVRIGQLITEDKESVLKLCNTLVKMAENFNNGFHELFPLKAEVIDFYKR